MADRDIDLWFRLWALYASQIDENGWYRQQPWYTEPRRGQVDHDHHPLSDDDVRMAHRVAQVMERVAEHNHRDYMITRVYLGAYPTAPDRPDRVKILAGHGIGERDARRVVERVKQMVRGALILT